MQKILLLLLLMIGASTVQAQTLKELLYGGKLKMDSNTVIRKTDDLKAKIDTAQKKPAAVAEKANPVVVADSVKSSTAQKDAASSLIMANDTAAVIGTNTIATTGKEETEAPKAAVPTKSNTKLWKEYTDSLVATLKPEINNAKKIKKDTYYVLVSYEIDTNGQVSFTNVGVTPGNELLQAQISQYLDGTALKLAPSMDSAGKPRKVKKSGSFTITKE